MADITLLPSAKVPLVYEGELTMTTEWYRFFWNVYGFTGSGTIPVNKGGTGLATIDNHEIIIGNTSNVFEPALLRGYGVTISYDPGFVNLTVTTTSSYQIATQGQTVFTGLSYIVGDSRLKVFVNGSKQIATVNYTETDNTSITFLSGLNAGDYVEFVQ
jgi:hypothetical protein